MNHEILQTLRSNIDHIDRQIVALLCKRLAIARRIAVHKKQHKLAIRQKERERAVLQQVIKEAKKQQLPEAYVVQIFTQIMHATRTEENYSDIQTARTFCKNNIAKPIHI